MAERRQYKRPPIQEAICEIRFTGAAGFDFASPARLYDLVRHEFSGEPRQEAAAGVFVDSAAGGFRVEQRAIPLTRFTTELGDFSMVIGEDVLRINTAGDYPGWEAFRSRIEFGLTAYTDVIQVTGIGRIGIRYVNRIEVGLLGAVDLAGLFTQPPALPDHLADMTIANFILRVEGRTSTDVRLIETLASTQADAGRAAFVLDLDVIREWPDSGAPLSEAMNLVDVLRDQERDAFEAMITDKARELFDAD